MSPSFTFHQVNSNLFLSASQAELLLGEGRDEKPAALQLFLVENAVEQLEIVLTRYTFALRHITQVMHSGNLIRTPS